MTDTGKPKFVYVTYIRTTAEKLWRALIEPEFTRQYWAETTQECDWKLGSPWRIMIPDGRVADSGEVLVFRSAARPFRVENRVCVWQIAARQVMIADDDVDAFVLQRAYGRDGARSAIAGDDDRGAGLARGTHAGVGEVVSVEQTARDERHDRATEGTKRARQQRGGGDAVDVVVAVHEDRLAAPNRAHQPLDGAVEIEQLLGRK